MLNFNFSDKSLGLVSPSHFVYDFSKKMFLMFHVLLADQISLSLLLEILGSMCITIVCLPGCDVIKIESNLLSNQAVFLQDQKVKTKV